MKLSTTTLAALSVALLSPAVVNASPDKISVEACASAFANSIAVPGTANAGYKLDYRPRFDGSLADFYPTEYTYTLEARNPKSGIAFARARCSVDSRGVVSALSAVPLEAKVVSR